MSLPLRAAIIGTGGIAGSHHDGYLAAGVEVVALCDLDPSALAARQAQWGVVRGYTDLRELFAAGGFDMVSIAAPTAVHHPATPPRRCTCWSKAHRPRPQLADEMIAACERAGVILMVNHSAALQRGRCEHARAPNGRRRELRNYGCVTTTGWARSCDPPSPPASRRGHAPRQRLPPRTTYLGGPVASVYARGHPRDVEWRHGTRA